MGPARVEVEFRNIPPVRLYRWEKRGPSPPSIALDERHGQPVAFHFHAIEEAHAEQRDRQHMAFDDDRVDIVDR